MANKYKLILNNRNQIKATEKLKIIFSHTNIKYTTINNYIIALKTWRGKFDNLRRWQFYWHLTELLLKLNVCLNVF